MILHYNFGYVFVQNTFYNVCGNFARVCVSNCHLTDIDDEIGNHIRNLEAIRCKLHLVGERPFPCNQIKV
jgi:hypothetical protein